MSITKSGKLLAVLTAAAVACGGCSGQAVQTAGGDVQSAASETGVSADSEKTAKSIEEVYQEIEEKVSLKSPEQMDEDFISNYYGIDVSVLEEYVFSISEDAAQAETVIIMKVKDAGDLEGMAGCLQTVADEKKNEMENYIPEQFAIVEKSEVVTKDNYVWLVISENADSITDIIESGLF